VYHKRLDIFDRLREYPLQKDSISISAIQKNIHSHTYSWSGALIEKPPIAQLLKKFPAFNGTRRFITVFTRALHRSLS
jgi:hypothetical protein